MSLNVSQDTRYVVRRTDGQYLILLRMLEDLRQVATWTADQALATRFEFMTSATLAGGLDQDPCLYVERQGWEVIAVQDVPVVQLRTFSVPMLLAMLLCLFANFANAQSRFDIKPYMAIVAGQGLDLVTTIHDNPSHPCVETNPRLGGRNATTMSVMIPKLAIIGGTAALLRFAETRDSKAARWIAKSVAYAGGIVGAKDGLHNLRTCGF